jgi:DNA-binding MarR family transcriptional regulator
MLWAVRPVTPPVHDLWVEGARGASFSLTGQTIYLTLPLMLEPRISRLLTAYPDIFLACHRQHLREDGGGRAITEHQASVLDHLDVERSITLSNLAEHMGVSRSTMSITVERLVRGAYVVRRRDRKGGRCVGLTLTANGLRVKEETGVLDPQLVREMFRLMPAEELEVALGGIERLATYARILLKRRKKGRDR